MKYEGNKVSGVKIAYIGGGSRGWAWGLMSDLAAAEDMSGEVALYDIDREAAARNEVIGNRMNGCRRRAPPGITMRQTAWARRWTARILL